ncbi:hypothetical protein BWQ96_02324 [Gracilariopsis chorda]|uniref:Uncharacterized protein n=1 Tax=Gracilariopsis chorda TaxID=448386 RepID=A0A2V3J0N1_9FLOR|nr:hypothetical protein BWQ96_02324 [Gracilariopsis chorda]|eukprot:PXF47938.1 hypothetical protein BWQ96_02324 [Gracilariopsis chorda]
MLFERTATTVSLHATRHLSRQRPITVLFLYATLALAIALISYQVTFSIVLLPLASFSFSFLNRTPSYPPELPPALSRFPLSHAIGASNSSETAEQHAQINFASLPMRRPEAQLLLSSLSPDHVYLEYGASGTTLAFPPLVYTAFSIEHDLQVCRGIDSEMHAHKSLTEKLRAFCVPVSPGHAGWGSQSPFEEGTYAAFQNYVDLPRVNLSHVLFDRVLINGRARVACALRILPQLKPSSLVFFHDFFLRPHHYAAVLMFYEEVARVVAHAPVSGYTDEPMGMLVLRPRQEYLQRNADVSVARLNAIYAHYSEQAPTDASTTVDTAYQRGLLKTNQGGYPYIEMSRLLSRQTTRVRLLLDLVAIPFVVLTYMVLRDVFRKVFLEALSASSPRGHRLLGGDLLAAANWMNTAGTNIINKQTKSTSLPVTTTARHQPGASSTAKAE